ncbi:MAG TPA: hypothetical protein VFZ48_05070 [Candidatus Saccharimonadales bacterium]
MMNPIDFRKTSHIIFFAAFLPALSFGAGWLCAELIPNAPFWVETLSPLAAYALLYSAFDRFAWHWPIWRKLGIVTMPDVRGRWLGEQISSHRDKNGKNRKARVIMEIEQTFSSIHTMTYYRNWNSQQTATTFMKVGNDCALVTFFESEPKVHYDGDAEAHKGYMRLIQLPDTTLEGSYINAAGRSGELTFRRTRYTLHRTFNSVGGNASSKGKSSK